GLVFPTWPAPPAVEPLDPLPDALARAAAAATPAVVAAEGICVRLHPRPPPGPRPAAPPPGPLCPPGGSAPRLDRDPLPLVRAGTVAVRDLGRLARDLDLPDAELALLVDLLVETGILAVGGPFGQRSLGLRPEADAWLSAPRARRRGRLR